MNKLLRIIEVGRESEHGHIKEVKLVSFDPITGNLREACVTRDQILEMITRGVNIQTLTLDAQNNWHEAKVTPYSYKGDVFLTTLDNHTTKDNLGELPPLTWTPTTQDLRTFDYFRLLLWCLL